MWSLFTKLVSGKDAISVLSLHRWENTLPHLTRWFSPLTFQLTSVASAISLTTMRAASHATPLPDSWHQFWKDCFWDSQIKLNRRNGERRKMKGGVWTPEHIHKLSFLQMLNIMDTNKAVTSLKTTWTSSQPLLLNCLPCKLHRPPTYSTVKDSAGRSKAVP